MLEVEPVVVLMTTGSVFWRGTLLQIQRQVHPSLVQAAELRSAEFGAALLSDKFKNIAQQALHSILQDALTEVAMSCESSSPACNNESPWEHAARIYAKGQRQILEQWVKLCARSEQ